VTRLAVAGVLVLAGAWILAHPAVGAGHAALVRAEPAENAFLQRAPADVTLVFSEALDERASAITVLDAAGQAVATDPPEFTAAGQGMRVKLPKLDPGIYNVLWTNVSTVDGHGLQGSYPFTVLNPDGSIPDQANSVAGIGSERDPAPKADGIAVRALALLGVALAAGGALLILVVPAELPGARRPLMLAVGVGAAVLAVATLLGLELIRETYRGVPLVDVVTETRAGGYWLMRLGAVLAIVVGASAFLESPRLGAGATLAASGVYLYGFTATSHAAAGTGSGWGEAIDLIHAAGAVAWIGAVIGLALTARMAGRGGQPYRALLARFSLLASVAVFVLLGAGLLNSFVQFDRFERLWETRYGWTMVVKFALMGPLLGVALYNARWGRRRIEAEAPGEPRRFVRTVTAEAALGLLVFAAAAALTQTSVAKSIYDPPDARPFDQAVSAADLRVQLQVDPNQTGLNTYRVTLTDGADGSAADADRVRVTFRYQEDQTVGPSTLTLARTSSPGTFLGEGPYLPLEGRWRLEVEIRRPDVDDALAFFDVRPAGTAVTSLRVGGQWDNPTPGLTWNQFGAIAILLAAFGLAIFRSRLPAQPRQLSWAANGATVLGFGFGALLLFGVHGHTGSSALPANPVYPDANSISIGREIYQQNCVSCHGTTGVPPEGLDLNPYPLNLTVHVPQHPDGQLFRFIDGGVAGSAMPAWGEEGLLSEEQIWHVVNYLRTLGSVDQ
jgi:copper transport protein